MSRFLLDTNIVLLGLSDPERIPARVRRAVDGGHVYISVISYWEVVLKAMKGKLDVGDPRTWWADAIDKFGAMSLPLQAEHVNAIYTLSEIHRDPFDRALIAQAIAEDLTLATTDSEIRKYASGRVRVLA